MKFVLLVIAVVVLLWLLRSSLTRARGSRTEAPPSATPKQMLRCAHCGTHLPRDIALPGRGGVFCDAAHRAAYERDHPAS